MYLVFSATISINQKSVSFVYLHKFLTKKQVCNTTRWQDSYFARIFLVLDKINRKIKVIYNTLIIFLKLRIIYVIWLWLWLFYIPLTPSGWQQHHELPLVTSHQHNTRDPWMSSLGYRSNVGSTVDTYSSKLRCSSGETVGQNFCEIGSRH